MAITNTGYPSALGGLVSYPTKKAAATGVLKTIGLGVLEFALTVIQPAASAWVGGQIVGLINRGGWYRLLGWGLFVGIAGLSNWLSNRWPEFGTGSYPPDSWSAKGGESGILQVNIFIPHIRISTVDSIWIRLVKTFCNQAFIELAQREGRRLFDSLYRDTPRRTGRLASSWDASFERPNRLRASREDDQRRLIIFNTSPYAIFANAHTQFMDFVYWDFWYGPYPDEVETEMAKCRATISAIQFAERAIVIARLAGVDYKGPTPEDIFVAFATGRA